MGTLADCTNPGSFLQKIGTQASAGTLPQIAPEVSLHNKFTLDENIYNYTAHDIIINNDSSKSMTSVT